MSWNSWKPYTECDTAVMRVIKDDLLRWTCKRHAAGDPLDRHLLRDKALELAGEHGLTDFKCSEKWLTSFLKRYGFSLNLEEPSGPIFKDYRLWIDMMRSIITRYKHKDLFHVDELTMYSDVSPTGLSVSPTRQDELETSLKKTTVLLCCNASGTEKLPLLICGSYPAAIMGKDHMYSHSEDASINDGLLREWLTRLNCRMSSSGRRILLLVHRNRIGSFRNFKLSNIRHVFFPDDFPPSLRPLKRDVFHFVKMAYRRKYVKGIRGDKRRWNVENVVRSLMEAWREVPRDLIIASFQRTGFRTDNCFLRIHCNAWEDLETGVSFRRFVTFDDYLSANASHKRCESTGRSHSYNFRPRKTVRFDDVPNFAIDSSRRDLIVGHAQVNGNLKEIYVEKDIDCEGKKVKNLLKRSHDEAQLDEDLCEEAKSSDESLSGKNEDIIVIPTSARPPKVIDIRTIESTARGSKSGDVRPTTTRASLDESRTHTERDCTLDKTANNEEKCKNSRVLSNVRSIVGPEVDNIANDDISVALQQVFDDTSAVDSDAKEPNVRVVSRASPRDEIESTDSGGNVGCFPQKSLKRHSVNAEESRDNSNDGEPERKRSRSDSDWMRRYETAFVFGPFDLAWTVTTVSANSDNGVPQSVRPRRSCETERSIFTIRPRRD
ncbi:tigger transposable element-derived protein 4-like [Temnothorax curvispinosus]|uniref:Tigger transposable element-derived protein 4-like n=1 Tax=Temnothorax curvispinosus TaxID=300111 RepID=A0A6J1QLQ1_9HYME|nr:tigger transposable element-derived protein 4-like [Temnothorax curvispinosus]